MIKMGKFVLVLQSLRNLNKWVKKKKLLIDTFHWYNFVIFIVRIKKKNVINETIIELNKRKIYFWLLDGICNFYICNNVWYIANETYITK